MSSAQQVQMQVVYRLSAVVAGVNDNTIASIQLLGAGQICGSGQQVTQQRSVFGCSLCLRGDVLFGNNQ